METHTSHKGENVLPHSQIDLIERIEVLQKELIQLRISAASEDDMESTEHEIDHLQRLILANRHLLSA